MTDHYGMLGVDRAATREQIQRAYKRRAAKLHPDRGGDAGAMAAVNRAREVLLDPLQRAAYDCGGDDEVARLTQAELGAFAMIKSAFEDVLKMALQSGRECDDPIGATIRKLGAGTVEISRNIEGSVLAAQLIANQRARIKRMTAGQNPFDDVLAEALATVQTNHVAFTRQLQYCRDAQKLMVEFRDSRTPEATKRIGFLITSTPISWRTSQTA